MHCRLVIPRGCNRHITACVWPLSVCISDHCSKISAAQTSAHLCQQLAGASISDAPTSDNMDGPDVQAERKKSKETSPCPCMRCAQLWAEMHMYILSTPMREAFRPRKKAPYEPSLMSVRIVPLTLRTEGSTASLRRMVSRG